MYRYLLEQLKVIENNSIGFQFDQKQYQEFYKNHKENQLKFSKK